MKKPSSERVLLVRALKAEKVADYVREHDAIWPELVALYRRCGIVEVSSFLSGNRLAVFIELDHAVYAERKAELRAHPVERKWQAMMAAFDEGPQEPERFTEAFRLSACA